MRRFTVLAATALSSLVLAAAASAALPKPDGPIKVPTDLAGVKLGMKIKSADGAWGGKGDCQSSGDFKYCLYDGGEQGSAQLSAEKGEISSAVINAGFRDGQYSFKGPLMKFETKEGLGLGDKLSKVKKAYPKAKKNGTAGFYIAGKGKSAMGFTTNDGKHITGIYLSDGLGG
ncbi:MAG: hypothetical protein U0R51_04570 [Solirubrobacterales bacterium]